jgi:plastocyanin
MHNIAREDMPMKNRDRTSWRIGGALAALVVLLMAGYAGGSASTPVIVEVKEFTFTPASITIPPGTTVTWRNADESPHTITSTDGVFGSSALENTGTFAYTFTKPGTYHYFCKLHPHMRADVVVR